MLKQFNRLQVICFKNCYLKLQLFTLDYHKLLERRCPWCNGYRRRKWTRVQILDESDCISPSTNTIGKGMNPIILPSAMGK